MGTDSREKGIHFIGSNFLSVKNHNVNYISLISCPGKHEIVVRVITYANASLVLFVNRDRGGSRGRVQWVRTPPPPTPAELTCGFLIQLIFCKKRKKTMWFIGVVVEQETSAPPPKKNPGSAPARDIHL